ncbi:GNAT family N-acetyltransferase [Streptomyces qinzhouensis]|uniref:GNAT family N-acetyltransferase n=1 Tax=Streptomyces qinzhouensis TaxID=2599401 RepID=A0A5B8JCN3_9ACTN|nr:GNAT family protein [Streptomyces qinzhouensis]QDY75253.1 GNAT family N-acetyltransferase [Streptomyces qinzhouensis]
MNSFWIGERVRLRGIEPGDWAAFMRFDEHSADQRSGDVLHPPRSAEGYRAWAKEQAAEARGDCFQLAIEALDSGEPVGTIGSHEADARHGRFMYGIAVGSAHQRKGYAAEAAVLFLRYMFAERRFHKCEARVYAYNEASLALHRRLGFAEEGRLRDYAFLAGRYRDLMMLGLLADEFAERYGLGGLGALGEEPTAG